MTASRLTWLTVLIVAAGAIPVYGRLSGHLAEMMGGRLLLWGIAWMLIVLVAFAALLVIGLATIIRWQRG